MRILIFLLLIAAATSGCYYDSEEYLYPSVNTNCDTANVTFARSVKPILQQSCFSCHGNGTAASFGNNIKLEDHADVKAQADNGKLYGAIAQLSGYSPMPKGGGKLDDCKINTIKIWIDANAPNN